MTKAPNTGIKVHIGKSGNKGEDSNGKRDGGDGGDTYIYYQDKNNNTTTLLTVGGGKGGKNNGNGGDGGKTAAKNGDSIKNPVNGLEMGIVLYASNGGNGGNPTDESSARGKGPTNVKVSTIDYLTGKNEKSAYSRFDIEVNISGSKFGFFNGLLGSKFYGGGGGGSLFGHGSGGGEANNSGLTKPSMGAFFGRWWCWRVNKSSAYRWR